MCMHVLCPGNLNELKSLKRNINVKSRDLMAHYYLVIASVAAL